MAERHMVLGVDIGGTNCALGLVDGQGNCLGTDSIPTRGKEPASAFFPRLEQAARQLLESFGSGCLLKGIGIGAPNANHRRCSIEDPPNLAWGRVDLRAHLGVFGVPVVATNDANAAALGELRFGAARGLRDVLVITLGTGLGSGLIVDGRLVYGATGFAGELGHVGVDPEGRRCGCGKRGCLETYVSATGLVGTVREWLAARSQASSLRELEPAELTAKGIHAAALNGDALAQEAFAFTGELLGRKLADSVAHTSPEAIVLFGGLAAAGELLFAPVREALEANLFTPFRGSVKLLPSGIQGNAAVLGAAALAWSEIPGAPEA